MANITKRISKKGVVSYRIKVSLGYNEFHKQITKSFTWTPDPGMTDRQIKKELQRQAAILESESERIPKITRRVKFRELSEEWLAFVEQTGEMKTSSLERIKGLRARTYKALGNLYVDEITYRIIQKFILSLSKAGTNSTTGGGLSEKTQKHYVNYISDVMKYAMKCELIPKNPCVGITVAKTGKREREAYDVSEEADILRSLTEENAPLKYRAFFALAVYCGFRRSEIMGLEWKDIDFENKVISIVRTSQYRGKNTGIYTDTPKTKNSERHIVVTDTILDILEKLRMEQIGQKIHCGDQWVNTDRLFTQWNGKPMSPNTPYVFLQKFCEQHDIPFKGVHSFRHAFATNLIASNEVDIRTVSALMGHSQTSTTLNIYAHEVKKASARGMQIMADLVEKAANNDHE